MRFLTRVLSSLLQPLCWPWRVSRFVLSLCVKQGLSGLASQPHTLCRVPFLPQKTAVRCLSSLAERSSVTCHPSRLCVTGEGKTSLKCSLHKEPHGEDKGQWVQVAPILYRESSVPWSRPAGARWGPRCWGFSRGGCLFPARFGVQPRFAWGLGSSAGSTHTAGLWRDSTMVWALARGH